MRIQLAHGEGLRLTRQLIRHHFAAAFQNPTLQHLDDGAALSPLEGQPVVTTDAFVVRPIFFPGGDIGSLAVHGTINDLAAMGAEPKYLTVSFILEEGLPMATLERVIQSMAAAARNAGVDIVAGDTKVVERGNADQMFLTVTGIGTRPTDRQPSFARIQPGDVILLTGTAGDHGIAVLTARHNFPMDPPVPSDSAPLHGLLRNLWNNGIDMHFLRDPTRGGVAAVLHEIVEATALHCLIDQQAVPVHPGVRGASELLGIDPLFIANEGKMIIIVSADQQEVALELLRRDPLGSQAACIGTVSAAKPPRVVIRGLLGNLRVLDDPQGAPLPRIC